MRWHERTLNRVHQSRVSQPKIFDAQSKTGTARHQRPAARETQGADSPLGQDWDIQTSITSTKHAQVWWIE